MKKNPMIFGRRHGFTLIEMLVVFVIVISLAAVAFTMGPKMKRRGDAAKSIQNMRQIGTALMTYAVDHNACLPPPRGEDSEGKNQIHWHQVLLEFSYPDVEPGKFGEFEWWNDTDPYLRNPLLTEKSKPNAFAPWFPGYAMNRELSSNLGMDSGDWSAGKKGPQTIGIPLNRIPDTARTPIIAPRFDWHYAGADLVKPEMEFLLIEGKLPVLFVDGHLENIRPQEYLDRELDLAPTFKKK